MGNNGQCIRCGKPDSGLSPWCSRCEEFFEDDAVKKRIEADSAKQREQRRYEIARDFLSELSPHIGLYNTEEEEAVYCKKAVEMADALLAELEKTEVKE